MILYLPVLERRVEVLPSKKPLLVRSHAPSVSITYTITQEFPDVIYGLPARAPAIAPPVVESADDIVSPADAPL